MQTEDLGRTFSTPTLAYQADLENERRWLSFDLLCGRVDRTRPWWEILRGYGVTDAELGWFLDNPCPPDILGVNHYLNSERFLDERQERYPSWSHGGNERHAYADVEAVRVRPPDLTGPYPRLREAWERYGIPIAVTEAHHGSTREERARWLLEVWNDVRDLRDEGADIRAVTIWSLFGAYDWVSLLTRQDSFYEPGAFDVRGPSPRPTAIARVVRDLAAGRDPAHPVLDVPGWWRRPVRAHYPPVEVPIAGPTHPYTFKRARPGDTPWPLLITGASCPLGQAFARACDARGLPYRLSTMGEMENDILAAILRDLAAGRVVVAAGDTMGSPTYAHDLAAASLDLLVDEEQGVWRLAPPEALTPAEFVRRAARLAGLDPGRVESRPTPSSTFTAPRPPYSALGTTRSVVLPPLDDALARYLREGTIPEAATEDETRLAGTSA